MKENRVSLPVMTNDERGKQIIELCTDLATVLLERYCEYDEDRLPNFFVGALPVFESDIAEESIRASKGRAMPDLFASLIDRLTISEQAKQCLKDLCFCYSYDEGIRYSKISVALKIFQELMQLEEELYIQYLSETARKFEKDTKAFRKEVTKSLSVVS